MAPLCPEKLLAIHLSCRQPVNQPLPPPAFHLRRKRWVHLDLNQEPRDYESPALTVELWTRRRDLSSTPRRETQSSPYAGLPIRWQSLGCLTKHITIHYAHRPTIHLFEPPANGRRGLGSLGHILWRKAGQIWGAGLFSGSPRPGSPAKQRPTNSLHSR